MTTTTALATRLDLRAVLRLDAVASGALGLAAAAGAGVLDTENLINVPLQIRTVEVSVLLSEPMDAGPVRVSLRSKGQVDVARFAEQFGGGGHARVSSLCPVPSHRLGPPPEAPGTGRIPRPM